MHGFVVCKTILAIYKNLSIYLTSLIKYFKIYLAILETVNIFNFQYLFFAKYCCGLCAYVFITNIINNVIITKLRIFLYKIIINNSENLIMQSLRWLKNHKDILRWLSENRVLRLPKSPKNYPDYLFGWRLSKIF